MSHLFISYSHANTDLCDQLLKVLENAGFNIENDVWYDKHISGGRKWRDEIETALNEAFAVAVIVTAESMKSTYVTYEWSYALGAGIPVIPLMFENLNASDFHARIGALQWIPCYKSISEEVVQVIRECQKTPPDTVHLNQLITNNIMKFRVYARTSLWLKEYVEAEVVDLDTFGTVMDQTIELAMSAHRSLLSLLVDKAYAFTAKQKRNCRNLSQGFYEFWQVLRGYQLEDEPAYLVFSPAGLLRALPDAEYLIYKRLEPLIETFATSQHNEWAYNEFITYLLNGFSSRYVYMPPQKIVTRIFADKEDVSDLWQAIEIVRKHKLGN